MSTNVAATIKQMIEDPRNHPWIVLHFDVCIKNDGDEPTVISIDNRTGRYGHFSLFDEDVNPVVGRRPTWMSPPQRSLSYFFEDRKLNPGDMMDLCMDVFHNGQQLHAGAMIHDLSLIHI